MEAVCLCGARYERTEETVSVRDHNCAVCQLCGAGLAAWCSFRVPVHRLKQCAQDEKPKQKVQGKPPLLAQDCLRIEPRLLLAQPLLML